MTKKIGIYRRETVKGVQWIVRWYGEYEPTRRQFGKRKHYSRTFIRKTDAERFQRQKQNEFEKGRPRDSSNETLKEYTVRWLENKTKLDDLRPATVLLYELTLKRLYNHFGPDMPLRLIDREAAKTFLAELKPVNGEKRLGNWSKHRVLRHCKTLFKEAVKDGKIGNNPFDEIARPKCKRGPWYYLKADEFHKLIDNTPKLREKVLYALAYTAGLRESEALALYWTDIDFDKGRIRINNRAATKEYPPFDIKDTYARPVPLAKMTSDLLIKLQLESTDKIPFVIMDQQDCQRIRDKWQECQKRGRPWLNRYWANNIIRNFHRRVQWAEIDTGGKALTVHVLRKCCCQNWANTLPMNVVKEFMGHSSIDTTDEFYNTVDDDHFSKAVSEMNDLLKKADEEKTDAEIAFSGNLESEKSIDNSVKYCE